MPHSLQVMFILPLMTGHLFWKATILGVLYRGVPPYVMEIGLVNIKQIPIYKKWQYESHDTRIPFHP